MSTMHSILEQMPPEAREALAHSHQVTFPAGTRIFKEHQRAEKFWIIECGTVDLDTHVPGRKNAVIDTLGYGELLGWSWMFRPYTWHLGATATHEVRALEFDAAAIRELCNEDSAVGRSVSTTVAAAIADRLDSARTRLLDLFAPHGSGTPLVYAR
ncbi:cyclic nucleotide-binding domain-containing protein [Streptomyces sp. NPDC051582]|uniref:cyclic nucleotide-binding domain-containing protein n=1 Tax=Streptomyces sp. NPDC051582 TaxID=3155167 RepID=UPI00342485E9